MAGSQSHETESSTITIKPQGALVSASIRCWMAYFKHQSTSVPMLADEDDAFPDILSGGLLTGIFL